MEIRIVIFGDSIAWGSGDPVNGGWVAMLRQHFAEKGFPGIEIFNLGVPGDTTDDLVNRFRTECEARSRHPLLILFAIGINDSQYIDVPNHPRISPEKFISNLAELVNMACCYTEKIIFAGLTKVDEHQTMPIPWAPETFYTNGHILKYDEIIQSFCMEKNLPFIGLYDLIEPEDLADGLHPNPSGHKKIFMRIKEFLISGYL